jgi:prolyl oligopeptidase PreP (S9A serine peptidase family)
VPRFDVSLFAMEQVFYMSCDGTWVPMFVVSKHNTPRDGSALVYLYAILLTTGDHDDRGTHSFLFSLFSILFSLSVRSCWLTLCVWSHDTRHHTRTIPTHTHGQHTYIVVPLHSYKYILALQHTVGSYEKQVQPLMIRIETKAGHGGGKPTSKAIEEAADTYTFIARTLGLTWTD